VTSIVAAGSARSQHRPVGGRIYSVGYEGLELAGLVDHLKSARVTTLVDVRLTPVSRKRGFSRKSLSAELEKAGITYIHEKTLGNPPDNRDSFRQGDAVRVNLFETDCSSIQ
jgi:hypothetical protein